MSKVSQQISTSIDKRLSRISKTSSNHQFIFRIDNILRMTCKAAYEPEMVSIGPYHRGKNNLQKMENYKLEYLQGILRRQNESSVGRYINSLIQDEEKARSYYAEHVSLRREDFVEMMLLDGCFIIEFLRKYEKKDDDHDDDHQDPIFKMGWILEILRRDFLLFENQIPFFILVKLFDMTKIPDDDQEENLVPLVVSCLNDCIIVDGTINYESFSSSSSSYILSQPENVFHLLSLMYESWCCCSFADVDDDDQNGSNSDRKKRLEFSCITLGKPSCSNNTRQQLEKEEDEDEDEEEDLYDMMFIKSVSELEQDGIKFGKSKQSKSWLDIKFEKGEIKIPPLVIQDGTESILRNLIAYEQYMFDLGHSGKFVTDYAMFMDCLINTPMDVKELRVKGIIKNWLGDDGEITDMFNKIGNNVLLSSPPYFTYREIFKKVNEHCNRRRNLWVSDLKRMYFKNPWSIISLLAAILFLVLTLIQTVFSILQHFKKDHKVVCNCK